MRAPISPKNHTESGSASSAARYAAFLMKYHHLVLAISLLTAIAGAVYSIKLYKNLRTDLEELLPVNAQSVKDVREVVKRVGGFNHLSIVIESPNPEAGARFQKDLSAELRKLPQSLVARVQDNIIEEREFFSRYKALYMDLEDWRTIDHYVTERIRTAKAEAKSGWQPFRRKKNPEFEDKGPKPPEVDFKALQKKYKDRAAEVDKFPDGYFRSSNGYTSVVLAYLPGKITDQKANERLFHSAQDIVRRLDPKRYDRQMVIGFNGDVSNMIEEHEGLIEDLELSTLIVLVLVALAMWAYFQTLAGVYALCAALFCGTFITFGVSYVLVGYLNANTAFLGSIVLGNGINSGIIFLARYLESRAEKASVEAALRQTIDYTFGATWVASAAAGAAYGSLIVTDFRGFNQFGVIGALGMMFCWLATFSVLPALLIAFEKRGWVRPKKAILSSHLIKHVSRFVMTYYRQIVWATLASILVSGALCLRFGADTLESDFSKLRNKHSLESGSGYWSRKVDAVFGRYLTPSVIVTQTREQAHAVAEKLREYQKRDGDLSPISDIKIIEDLLPKYQEEKIRITDHIRSLLTPQVIRHMRSSERARMRAYLPEEGQLKVLSVDDLPEGVKVHFRELDGAIGTMVHVYPRTASSSFWNANDVIQFAEQMRQAIQDARVPGGQAAIAGQPPLSADMISSIAHDGPKATLVAFLAVAFLVIVIFRQWAMIQSVIGALVLGVLWMAAIMALYDIKINFLNFIALPITFGIGVDYSVNIFSRLAADLRLTGRARIEDAIEHTGGAVALCSLTTIIGYGSLLIAGSQAFVSFGVLAVLGELTCLPAALIAVPAFWLWKESRNSANPSKPSGPSVDQSNLLQGSPPGRPPSMDLQSGA